MKSLLLLVLSLVCAHPGISRAQKSTLRKSLTVLISIDGFRPEYLERGLTPVLSALSDAGARAEAMVPSFPSVTFPNHITLVTGVVPDKHGVVNNVMNDPNIPNSRFRLSDRAALSDQRWWDEATPIWVTAHRQNKIASTLFWPGSEVSIQGVQPDDWLPYQEIPSQERVEKLLTWLNRPDEARADFATLYFSEVDILGHQSGTVSAATNAAIGNVDMQIGLFLQGIEKLHLRDVTNIVIVSDHGMADTSLEKVIDLSELSPELNARDVVWTGAFAGVEASPAAAQKALQKLKAAPNMDCWRKSEIPAEFEFGSHRRIPEIFCLAQSGWSIVANRSMKIIPGQHGYAPRYPDMSAIFIASGPNIKTLKTGVFKNVEIYGLLCELLGITPEPGSARSVLAEMIIRK